MTTKDKILDSSLDLFSRFGYEAVSVAQIAEAVGIQAPSLYKHFKSKQDIFDAIFDEMKRRYDEQTAKMQLHIGNAMADKDKFAAIDSNGLVAQVQELIRYSIQDGYVSRFRRLMTIEQFRSPELSALYTKRYVGRLVGYHEKLFEGLVSVGVLRDGDVHSMALQFTCPVLILLSVCDRQPEAEERAMAEISAHIKQFVAANHA